MADKKTAIITGAPRGIDAAASERLVKDGFNILINYFQRRPKDVDLVAKSVRAAGTQARTWRGDVADPGRQRRCSTWRRLNSAGSMSSLIMPGL